jgi:hypothetical protein
MDTEMEECYEIVESFDDYTQLKLELSDKILYEKILKDVGYETYIASMNMDLISQSIFDAPKASYDFIRTNSIFLLQVCRESFPHMTTEISRLSELVHGLYELDCLCGNSGSTTKMNIGQDEEDDGEEDEFYESLVELDKDREKFKILFSKNYDLIEGDVERELYIKFANLIFMFNSYRAPIRIDPKKAYNDALGLTDLFGEFLEELGISDVGDYE